MAEQPLSPAAQAARTKLRLTCGEFIRANAQTMREAELDSAIVRNEVGNLTLRIKPSVDTLVG